MHRTMMDRFPFLAFLLALFLVLLGGGGRGGGGGADAPSPTPTPVPTPDVELDIGILDGTWKGVSGSGTATGPDGTFDLDLSYATASFVGTSGAGGRATTTVTADALWHVFHGEAWVRSIRLTHDDEGITLVRTGANAWEWTFPSGESRLTITMTSSTTATIVEEGIFALDGWRYRYAASYRMTKIR
ncbi:MAG: hypothetical protein IJR14_06610 [Synergistaceae bacterium]|nr:hypothetical protein [Synergistaceae bacterium]